jgi:CDP-diacylglycerol--serine O-phosphatidyltransferase
VLVVAIVLDMLDGRIARALHATSRLGRELDSLSDAISCGAAPALLIHQAVLRPLGPFGVAVALVYLLAGIFRLARYNVLSDAHSKGRRTMGLPIPISAAYLMAVVLMRDHLDPLAGAGIALAAGVAMVSRWPLPELKGLSPVTATMVVGIFNYLAVVFWPNWYTVGWWNLWNAVILLAARGEDRRLARTIHEGSS